MLALPGIASAGAWPEAAGHWLDINTFSYYQVAVQGYNQFGKPTGTGTYRQSEFAPYIEYGLTDRVTLGFQPRLQIITQSGLPGTGHSFGLVQANLFARYEVFSDGLNIFSVQAQAGIPGAANNRNPELPMPNAEYEARLLYGRSLALGPSLPGFINAEAGYRLEGDGAADQFRGDLTLGLNPVAHWQVLAQSFNTVALGTPKPGESGYDLYRVECSVVRDISPHAAVQLGAWHDAGGRNIALGNAGILALWLRF
jgi:hypothetical protein